MRGSREQEDGDAIQPKPTRRRKQNFPDHSERTATTQQYPSRRTDCERSAGYFWGVPSKTSRMGDKMLTPSEGWYASKQLYFLSAVFFSLLCMMVMLKFGKRFGTADWISVFIWGIELGQKPVWDINANVAYFWLSWDEGHFHTRTWHPGDWPGPRVKVKLGANLKGPSKHVKYSSGTNKPKSLKNAKISL